MPIFTYVVVVGSALIALLFVMGATPEKAAPPIVTSERQGCPSLGIPTRYKSSLPRPHPRRHDVGGCTRCSAESRAGCRGEIRRGAQEEARYSQAATGPVPAELRLVAIPSAGSSAAFRRRCNRRILGVPIPTLGKG